MSKKDFRVLNLYIDNLRRTQKSIQSATRALEANSRQAALVLLRSQVSGVLGGALKFRKAYIDAHPLSVWAKRAQYEGVITLAGVINLDKMKSPSSVLKFLGMDSYRGRLSGAFSRQLSTTTLRLARLNLMNSSTYKNLVWHQFAKLVSRHMTGELREWEDRMLLMFTTPNGQRLLDRHQRCKCTCFFVKYQAYLGPPQPHLPTLTYLNHARAAARRIWLGHIVEAMFVVERGYRPYMGQDKPNYIPPPAAGYIPGWRRAKIIDCWGGKYDVLDIEDWQSVSNCEFWKGNAKARLLRTRGFWRQGDLGCHVSESEQGDSGAGGESLLRGDELAVSQPDSYGGTV